MPGKTGGLVIYDVDANQLLIRAENGETYKIDKNSLILYNTSTGKDEIIGFLTQLTPSPAYPAP